ncbi:MAG TPA: bifunctional GNAT family N-acetyltransferase/acetate--CoA ligase family protein [Mycobacteriales bacterium]|nr:bifunctional GNAT family N-acetyltransferase/acetate--CoA ligase family protein [Mycobacteriales bacterium]
MAGAVVAGSGSAGSPGGPEQWECDVVLADGGTAHLRPVRPEDADTLVELFGRLSPETILMRFFSMKRTLTDRELERLTRVDYHTRMALVALIGDELVGLAGYDRLEGTEEAEVAFLVEDVHHGRGLGTLMLEHLAVIASQHGIARFVAETFARNRKMLGVFRAAGFTVSSGVDEEDVAWVEFAIRPTDATIAAIEDRERRAEARAMARLLSPRAIALIGMDGEFSGFGRELLRKLIDDFQGSVYPVHPTARQVAAVHAYPSVLDVPDDVDLAIILVPPPSVAQAVRECAEKRVRASVVVTPTVADGARTSAATQREVVALARRGGMRVVGPGSLGLVNTAATSGMNATIGANRVPPGPLGCLSQSGALGVAMLERAAEPGLGVSTFVSTGAQADVSSNELLQYWEGDPATAVVLLYLESFGNPRTFARVARRVSRRKPIVAVQSGRARAGSAAPGAGSDGSAPRNPDVAVDALFHQAGIIRVDTFEQLFDVATLLVTTRLPSGRRVAVVSNSTGLGNLGADACDGAGLLVPELPAPTQAVLTAGLSTAESVRNPVNLSFAAPGADYETAIRAVLTGGGVDAMLVLFSPASRTARFDEVEDAIARASGDFDVPILASFLGARPGKPGTFPVFSYPESAAHALGRVSSYAEWRRRHAGVVPVLDGIAAEQARLIVDAALAAEPAGTLLAAGPAASLLSHYGIDVVPGAWATSAEEAIAVADAIGYPAVLKAASPRLLHRRDVGGVRLALSSPEDVAGAYAAIASSLGEALDGVQVQRMVPQGVDTTVGVVQDPSFGPLLVFGLAGVEAELLGDRSFRILPLTDVDARDLIMSVKGAPLLFGYRGAPPANVAALEQLLLRVARLIDDIPDIAELELDPVIVNIDGAFPINARLRLVPARPQPGLPYRRLE